MSSPQLSPSHHSGAGQQDKVWLPPWLSAHSPCCRDEASSISSPATLCKRGTAQVTSAGCRPLLRLSPALAISKELRAGPRISLRDQGARMEGVYRQQQQVLKAQQGLASTPAPNTAGVLQEAGGRSALTWLQPRGFPTHQLPKTC